MALSDELAHLAEYAAEVRWFVRICLACKILSWGISVSYVYTPERSLSTLDLIKPNLSQVVRVLRPGGCFIFVSAWEPDRLAARLPLFDPLELVPMPSFEGFGPPGTVSGGPEKRK